MKKRQLVVVAAAIMALAVVMGCASNSQPAAGAANAANPNFPEWYINPPQDTDYIFGVGNAKMASTNRSQQAAEHRARTSLAFELNTFVRGMQDDYGQEAGTTNDMAVLELFENVDRQLASASLSGSNVVKRFVAPDGTHWALVSYAKNTAKTETTGVIENAASKAAAIQRDAAMRAMDAAFEKMSKPQLVDYGE